MTFNMDLDAVPPSFLVSYCVFRVDETNRFWDVMQEDIDYRFYPNDEI